MTHLPGRGDLTACRRYAPGLEMGDEYTATCAERRYAADLPPVAETVPDEEALAAFDAAGE